MPSQGQTTVVKRHQDMVAVAIKQARAAALIPYTVTRKVVVNHPFENIR
ncbi:MAG: hypothetical protein U9Q62_04245 [Campylobacterota bacterium]|nr:hypothetical protein [Campylobacterota bacterium]